MKNSHNCCLLMVVLFFIVANPVTYKLVNDLLGKLVPITDHQGRPTQQGVAVHAVVFGLLCYCCCSMKLM